MRIFLLLGAALALPYASLTAQRAPASRFGPTPPPLTLPASAVPSPTLARAAAPHPRVRKWPFVVGGALVGGALGVRYYVRAINANDDGDFLFPLSAIAVVSIGTVGGALGGWAVGSVVQEVAGPRR